MELDYLDMSALIEHIIENAKDNGILITSVNMLYVYLEDNSTEVIKIIKHD